MFVPEPGNARVIGRKRWIVLAVLLVALGLLPALSAPEPPGEELAANESGLKPCRALTCERLHVECGEWDDGCGGTVECGACEEDSICVEGQCVAPGEWSVPDCSRIAGTGAVSFTTDEGLTLTGTRPLMGTSYSFGLAVLDLPDTLLATQLTSSGNHLLRSESAGCRWAEVAQLEDWSLLRLTAAPGGEAYVWSRGRQEFYRVVGDEVEALSAPGDLFGLSVDPLDPEHLRIGSFDCQIYESFDGGESFVPVGSPANTGNGIFFTVEFDPGDWDRALCGTLGAWRTTDGGQSWDTIEPFEQADPDWVYLFVFAPGDPLRVWARANLESLDRQILVSEDGGASFVTAVQQGTQAADQNGIARTVTLTNTPTMEAHPEDPGVLYFVFGTYFQGYGTDLFRYDLLLDELSVVHIDELDGINAFAFSPVDPAVIYVGLEEEQVN